jgi:hypothetical protein
MELADFKVLCFSIEYLGVRDKKQYPRPKALKGLLAYIEK